MRWPPAATAAPTCRGSSRSRGRTHALRFSRFDGGGWSAPIEIARGDDWFVNWADHPSLTAGADGTLFAHWLVHTSGGEGGYGYAIRGAASRDGGRTWRTVLEEGARNVKDYSGFLHLSARGRRVSMPST